MIFYGICVFFIGLMDAAFDATALNQFADLLMSDEVLVASTVDPEAPYDDYFTGQNIMGGGATSPHPVANFFSSAMAANRFLPMTELLTWVVIFIALDVVAFVVGLVRWIGRFIPALNID